MALAPGRNRFADDASSYWKFDWHKWKHNGTGSSERDAFNGSVFSAPLRRSGTELDLNLGRALSER